MSAAQRGGGKYLLDYEYFTLPERREEEPTTQPPRQQPSQRVSAEEYIRSTEHLLEPETPSLVKHGIDWYARTGEGWVRVTVRGDLKVEPASPEEVAEALQKGTHYYVPPGLAEKMAKEAPLELWAYGPEEAAKTVQLLEMFPELKEKGVTHAALFDVMLKRLEEKGVRLETAEDYSRLYDLAWTVLKHPQAWRLVEEDIERQLAEIERLRKQAHFERQLERGLLPETVWQETKIEDIEKHFESFYRLSAEHHPFDVFLHALGATFARSFFVPMPVQGYETLVVRREELAAKVLPPSIPLLVLNIPLPPQLRIELGKRLGVYSKEELAEIKAIEKHTDWGKEAAYTLGTALGVGMAWKAWGKGLELTAKGIAKVLPSSVKVRLEKVAERLKLIEREQVVPERVVVEARRLSLPEHEYAAYHTRIVSWKPAKQVLGREVLPTEKLQPGEVSWLPLERGLKAPVVGEGRFVAGAATKEGRYLVEGWGVFRESELRWAVHRATPHVRSNIASMLRLEAKVDYPRLLQQLHGSLPKAVLEVEGKTLGISPTPRIPVREIVAKGPTSSLIPPPPPLRPEVKIPAFERERGREPHVKPPPLTPELKLPVIERFKHETAPKMVFNLPPRVADVAIPRAFTTQAPSPRQAQPQAPQLSLPQVSLPKPVTPKPELAPPDLALPKLAPPAPKLPPLPLPLLGRRDLPALERRLLRARREWTVRWFGAPPEVKKPARRAKRSSRRKRR